MKKPKLQESINLDNPDLRDNWFIGQFPNLYEGLSRLNAEAGKPRQRHSLFVVWEDGCFRVCVRDRQEGCEAWFQAVTFVDALTAAELAVETGEGPWKPLDFKGGKKKK
jgi:hypothetical protein